MFHNYLLTLGQKQPQFAWVYYECTLEQWMDMESDEFTIQLQQWFVLDRGQPSTQIH